MIKVGSAGVNPVDSAVRSGAYHLLGEPPFTLGWDVAGVIESTGPGVSAFRPGEEVLGLLGYPDAGNAYADYVPAITAGGLLIGALGGNLGITPQHAANLGIRVQEVSVRPSAADLAQLLTLIESGKLAVHVDQALALADAAKAHELSAAGRSIGKTVLIP